MLGNVSNSPFDKSQHEGKTPGHIKEHLQRAHQVGQSAPTWGCQGGSRSVALTAWWQKVPPAHPGHDTRAHVAPPATLCYSLCNTSAHFCGFLFFSFLPSPSLHNKLECHSKDCIKHRWEAEESVSCYLRTVSIF